MSNIIIRETAEVIGRLRIGKGSIISQGTIIISEEDSIKIGNESYVLENSVVIGTKDYPVEIGSKTVFGHKCTIIGANIGDLCEIGNCVTILEGSKIGNMCIFGEGTIIPPNSVIPDGSVVLGKKKRILRRINNKDKLMIKNMRSGNIELSKYEEHIVENKGVTTIMSNIYEYKGKYPTIDESAKIMGSAEITGEVSIGKNTYIASGVKIIGDSHGPVKIGNNVIILENSVLHLLPDNQLIIEDNVVIGPNSMIHGTKIGKNSIIESGSIICDFSKLGENTLVKSGTLIPQRSNYSSNEILEGFPAKSVGKNGKILSRPNWARR